MVSYHGLFLDYDLEQARQGLRGIELYPRSPSLFFFLNQIRAFSLRFGVDVLWFASLLSKDHIGIESPLLIVLRRQHLDGASGRVCGIVLFSGLLEKPACWM